MAVLLTNLCSERHSLLWKSCSCEVTGHICHSPLQQVLAHRLLLQRAGEDQISSVRTSDSSSRDNVSHSCVFMTGCVDDALLIIKQCLGTKVSRSAGRSAKAQSSFVIQKNAHGRFDLLYGGRKISWREAKLIILRGSRLANYYI